MNGSVVFARLRQCAPPPNTCFLGAIRVQITNDISIGSAVFLHSSRQRVDVLYNGRPFPSLKCHRGSRPHLKHGSLGPPESSIQTAYRPVQPFLQGSLLWQTYRQTDRPRYSAICDRTYGTYVIFSDNVRTECVHHEMRSTYGKMTYGYCAHVIGKK